MGKVGRTGKQGCVRSKVRNFVKARYPGGLGTGQIRDPLRSALIWVHLGPVWLVCSRVALAFQAVPEREHRWSNAVR